MLGLNIPIWGRGDSLAPNNGVLPLDYYPVDNIEASVRLFSSTFLQIFKRFDGRFFLHPFALANMSSTVMETCANPGCWGLVVGAEYSYMGKGG